MKSIVQSIYEYGIVPVVKIDDAQDAVPLAQALLKGGIRCIEITFRTQAAEQAMKNISAQCPEMLLGAGSVLEPEQVDRATAAGAKFIVSPGFNPRTAQYCIDRQIPILPGCNNPSSVEAALELGLTDLKFFPAEQSGGLPMIKALCAPYTKVRFMPTGGVNEKNMNDYLSFPKVYACGGSWMVSPQLIAEKRFDEITQMSRRAIYKMLGFELSHIGFNCADSNEALNSARQLASLFGLEVKEGNSSIFAGKEFELMRSPYLGDKGHICIAVNNLDRVYSFLSYQGYEFMEDTFKYSDGGKLKAVYLKLQVSGFAIHFINK